MSCRRRVSCAWRRRFSRFTPH